ncbi:mitogen-activated protein kinase kinase kinase [Cryptococcus neoformans Gb118]|nr:mitogen-activated protein kinase kinase kinase [Cryptococcus neoformans var. grubii Gb118]
MSNPTSPTNPSDTGPSSASNVTSSSSKTGRRSVRLFAPDEEDSSDEDGGLIGVPAETTFKDDEIPPSNPRSASYPGPPAHTSPTSKISTIVSSASAAQPKLARSITYVAPNAVSSRPAYPLNPPGSETLHASYETWRKTRYTLESFGRGSKPDGKNTAQRGRSYTDPDIGYFSHDAGDDGWGSDDDDELRSPGWGISHHNMDSGGKTNGSPQLPIKPADVTEDEGQERLDWQGMLESVLNSDVLKVEEQRIYNSMPTDSFREEIGKTLWWQIRAKLRGRTEAEEKKRVQERRARVVDPVLEEINEFKYDPKNNPEGEEDSDGDPQDATSTAAPQSKALNQVNTVLAKLHAIKGLYPNLAAMRADKVLYTDENFRKRADALTSWSIIVSSLQTQLKLLQKWTGSDELDITKPNTTHEKALVGKYKYHSIDSKGTPGRDAADDSSFLDRVIKEDNLQRTFERRAFVDMINLVRNAKETVISYLPQFQEQNLPDFQYEIVRLIGFPGRLIIEAVKVRLDAASRLLDPNPMVVEDFIENLRLSISLAVLIRKQYDEIMAPDAEGRWKIPHCLPTEYNDVLLDALRTFFKLLHWRLRGVGKASYYKETEVLEEEAPFLYEAAEAIVGGDMVVAEQYCALSNKLLIRSANYLDQQLRVPIHSPSRDKERGDKERDGSSSSQRNRDGRDSSLPGPPKHMKVEELFSWYSKLLDSARMRHRKTQRFCRKLTQRFDNSAEYSIEETEMDMLVETLQDTGHFLVYTGKFEANGTYIVADGSLWGQPDDVRHLLKRVFSVTIPGSRVRPRQTTSQVSVGGASPSNGQVAAQHDPADPYPEADDFDDEALAAYILLISPRQSFVWSGAVMTLDVDYIDYELPDNRVRLIADGPTKRLALCKLYFKQALIHPDTGETIDLPCVVEAQAHLPTIQKQLVKIAKSSYRLSECIVQSAPLVRNAFRGKPGSQELVENWYSFATEHGTRVLIHIEPSVWERFNRLLMRLAISWISFISQECNPTDRKTFRWTVAALTYAFNMTRGSNILALDRSEFSLLRRYVGVCVSLLVSHFDILGARSSMEAKKEADRIEAMRRLQRLQENLDDEFLPRTPTESGDQPRIDRSIRLTVEERLRLIAELEARRDELAPAPVGQVLDEEVSEDRALVFLAASKSSISMRWQQGAYIGGGASGSVYLGYSLQDNTVFAVKILPTVDLQSSPALYESIKRESDVMSLLSHPNIVGFLGLEVHRNRVCLFQEYCEGGSLAGMLEYGKIDDEEVVGAFTIQLLRGLEYLHTNRIEHRDLKPENILIGANSVLKLADFGTAKIIKSNKTLARTRGGAHAKMEGLEGTPMYMAPEMIKNQRTGKLGACDIWGLGCIVLQMITGRKPWSFLDFDNEWAIMFHLGATKEPPPLPDPNEMSDQGIEFIDQCLSLDPEARPVASELLQDEWLVPMLEQMAELEQEYPDILAMGQSDSFAPPPENASLTSNAPIFQDDVTPPPLE